MADQSALKRAFSDYARTIARRYDIGDVLYRLTDQVVDALGVDGAGVSLADGEGNLQFVTATSQPITEAEEGQIEARQGPCHDAFHSGDVVTAADLTADDRWPQFKRVALQSGQRAVAGIPMLLDDYRIGAVSVYNSTPREWPADDLEDAQLLADMATGYIINAQSLSASERLANQLQHALESRVTIEQAKGIIAERHQVPPSAAFDLLRAHARSTNTKLHEIARAVIEDRLHV